MTDRETKPLQQKTIRKFCKRKLDHWVHILKKNDAEDIAEIVKENAMITGGAIASMLGGDPVNDYDVYFRTKEAALAVAQYYVKVFNESNEKHKNNERIGDIAVEDGGDRVHIQIKSAGIAAPDTPKQDGFEDGESEEDAPEYEYFEGTNGDEAENYVSYVAGKKKTGTKKYVPVFLTENAITLSDDIQIIIRFFGEPEEIHKNYDFVHCTGCYTYWDDKLHVNAQILDAVRIKKLLYIGSLYPICSIIRTRKFIKRGWSIDAGQYLKMAWQVAALELTNISVLKSQLVGVDAAYFAEFIEVLKKDSEDGKTIDQLYISQVIDKIFGNEENEE